jgi:hypothetical protein
MAAEYFLYNTLYNNTLVDRSNTSFAPLPPNSGEIFINYFIPQIQPLYLYRESGGTIVENDQQTVDTYIEETAPPPTINDPVEQGQFTGYTATTDPKLWNVFEPLDGTTPDDQRFEEYAAQQLANGQPIFLHDPNDLGFKFTGLTTGKDYNNLPWIGVNGGGSAPRLKLGGGSVFTSAGIRGVEFFIEVNANVELLGLSEHASVDLTEIRFAIGGSGNSLIVRAVNMTVGRVEGQTGTSNLIIKDRSNVQAQNLNEIENVYVEGGSILTANWVRVNTLIELGFDGTSVDNDGAIVTLGKPANLTTGEVIIFGQNNILTASNFPITIDSGATNNVILGMNNTITDNGSGNIILQELTGGTGTADGVVSGATLSGGTLALQRTLGLSDVTVDLSPLTGDSKQEIYAFSKTLANGTQSKGYGISVSRASTGVYNYSFDNATPDANYGVLGQPFNTTTDTNVEIINVTTTGFTAEIGQGDNGTSPDVLVDTDHTIIVVGVPISGSSGVPVVPLDLFTGYTASTQTELDGKIDEISGGTSDNVPVISAGGQLSDSGFAISDLTGSTGGGTWGSITGTLSDQTDLQNALDDKLETSDFDTYSGATDTRLDGIEDDITFLSGATDNKLETSDFDTYSGATDTRLDNIETDVTQNENDIAGIISTISGVTGNTIIQLVDNAGGQSLNDVVFNPIDWDTQDFVDSRYFSHSTSTNPSRINILKTGIYEMSYVVNGDSGNGRVVVGVQFRISGTTIVGPTLSASYGRNTSNDDTQNAIAPYTISLSSGDYVELGAFRLGDSTAVSSKADASFVKIKFIE